jgi:phospho-N-acetylmuramoyl-pentapeptide-transferase
VEGTAPSAFFDAQTLYSVAIASFVVSALVFPWYIKWLKKKQVEQYIREEGPQSHAAKAKTPTMGGLCFIAVSTVISLAFLILYWSMQGASHGVVSAIAVVITAMLCGLVGFADDFAKVTSKSNTGLSARARLLIEFVLGGLLGIALVMTNSPGINIGSILGIRLDPIWNAVYAFTVIPFLVAATTNAMNLHDGMDGLAGGTSIQVFLVLAIMLAF